MTCKDCIHFDRCKGLYRFERLQRAVSKGCPYFKDRFRFVELPCKVGDTVYFILRSFDGKMRINPEKVCYFTIDANELRIHTTAGYFTERDMNDGVFFTRERAEQVLKEREKMHEILFRGKRADNGEWVYGDLIHRQIWKRSVPVIIRNHDDGFDQYEEYEIDPSSVGQYTGLNDRNNEKIFDGDIVDGDYPMSRGSVAFSGGCFEIEHMDKAESKSILACWNEEINIIGNIYDNPELLKGEQ